MARKMKALLSKMKRERAELITELAIPMSAVVLAAFINDRRTLPVEYDEMQLICEKSEPDLWDAAMAYATFQRLKMERNPIAKHGS